jgi:membrane fusion protein (multidrug efflux system)
MQSRADLAKTNLARTKQLLDTGAIPRAEFDVASNELVAAESALASLRAQIGQKTVRAPFAGRTGIRAINVGQFLAPGTMITTLESQGEMLVDFSLPQENLPLVAVGNKVRIAIRGDAAEFDGSIRAVEPNIDPVTRNIKLRASVGEHGGKLRSGMYVTVQVVLPTQVNVVAVPLTAVVRATYGNSVFVIEDGKNPAGQPIKVARQQFVKLGSSRGDFAAVSAGLKAGQVVVSEGAFKLRNGAPVAIDNTVKPKAELDPHPENR